MHPVVVLELEVAVCMTPDVTCICAGCIPAADAASDCDWSSELLLDDTSGADYKKDRVKDVISKEYKFSYT